MVEKKCYAPAHLWILSIAVLVLWGSVWFGTCITEAMETQIALKAAKLHTLRADENLVKAWHPKKTHTHTEKVFSRKGLGALIKKIARSVGLYDMQIKVLRTHTHKKDCTQKVVVEFVAGSDEKIAAFVEACEQRLGITCLPQHLMITRGVVAEGSGEIAEGLTGSYVFSWLPEQKKGVKDEKKAFSGVQKKGRVSGR